MIVQLDWHFPNPRHIQELARRLGDGAVIGIPTDTTFALACVPDHKQALKNLRTLRHLDPKKPLALVFRDLTHISSFATVGNRAFRIIRRLLPGPYTFILEANRALPRMIGDVRKRIGVRVPNHAVPQALVEALGKPLIVTSAVDPDSEETLYDPWSIEAVFGHGIEVVVDSEGVPGKPSSIVDLTGDEPEVVRSGLGDVSAWL